jgi:hypothetical protein
MKACMHARSGFTGGGSNLKGKETKTQVASMACLMPFKFKQTVGSQGTPHKLQILGVQITDTDDFMQRAFQFGGLLWPMLGL